MDYKNAKTEDLIAVFNLFEKKGTGSKSNSIAKDMFAAIREELKIRRSRYDETIKKGDVKATPLMERCCSWQDNSAFLFCPTRLV